MRTTQETRSQLERAAADSGRSLAQEVEYRLDRSFAQEDATVKTFGGRKLHQLFQMIAGAIGLIEAETGQPWDRDFETAVATKRAVSSLFSAVMPPPDGETYNLLIADKLLEGSMPPQPIAPQWPDVKAQGAARGDGGGLFGVPLDAVPTSRQLADWNARREAYEKELAAYRTALEGRISCLRKAEQRLREAMCIGESAALSLLPNKTRQKSTRAKAEKIEAA